MQISIEYVCTYIHSHLFTDTSPHSVADMLTKNSDRISVFNEFLLYTYIQIFKVCKF